VDRIPLIGVNRLINEIVPYNSVFLVSYHATSSLRGGIVSDAFFPLTLLRILGNWQVINVCYLNYRRRPGVLHYWDCPFIWRYRSFDLEEAQE
jgi:hypothetical protein